MIQQPPADLDMALLARERRISRSAFTRDYYRPSPALVTSSAAATSIAGKHERPPAPAVPPRRPGEVGYLLAKKGNWCFRLELLWASCSSRGKKKKNIDFYLFLPLPTLCRQQLIQQWLLRQLCSLTHSLIHFRLVGKHGCHRRPSTQVCGAPLMLHACTTPTPAPPQPSAPGRRTSEKVVREMSGTRDI